MKILQKPLHGLWIGSAESVDRLVIVSHDKKIAAGKGQHEQKFILGGTHILELIDQDPLKAFPPESERPWILFEKIPAAQDHIVKINTAAVLQKKVVFPDQEGQIFVSAGKTVLEAADQSLEFLRPGSLWNQVRTDIAQMPEVFPPGSGVDHMQLLHC